MTHRLYISSVFVVFISADAFSKSSLQRGTEAVFYENQGFFFFADRVIVHVICIQRILIYFSTSVVRKENLACFLFRLLDLIVLEG